MGQSSHLLFRIAKLEFSLFFTNWHIFTEIATFTVSGGLFLYKVPLVSLGTFLSEFFKFAFFFSNFYPVFIDITASPIVFSGWFKTVQLRPIVTID